MREAINLASDPEAPRGINPRVGCVILDSSGAVVGRGFHRGSGTPHAEVVALEDAGARAQGGTAVVTLEPCRHVGRTEPCTQALRDAGVTRVVYAVSDPTSAGGGADVLAASGCDVVGGVLEPEARAINRAWLIAAPRGWPFVRLKMATSIDGRVSAPDGRQIALTGAEARQYVHQLRADAQAVMVGTGTVLLDDPQLTVRDVPAGPSGQPIRVAWGSREIPPKARVRDGEAPFHQCMSHDPRAVLAELFGLGVREVLVEGGPTVAGVLLAAGLVDEVVWLIAPLYLGEGMGAVDAPGLFAHLDVADVSLVGDDVRIIAIPR